MHKPAQCVVVVNGCLLPDSRASVRAQRRHSPTTAVTWNTASTVTGSVDDSTEPNSSASTQENAGNMPPATNTMISTAMTMEDSRVPAKAKAQMDQKLAKNGFFSMEYPDSKMMGGSRYTKNVSANDVCSLSATALSLPLCTAATNSASSRPMQKYTHASGNQLMPRRRSVCTMMLAKG